MWRIENEGSTQMVPLPMSWTTQSLEFQHSTENRWHGAPGKESRTTCDFSYSHPTQSQGRQAPASQDHGRSEGTFVTVCYRTTEVVAVRIVYESHLSSKEPLRLGANRLLLAESGFGRDSDLLFLRAKDLAKAMSRRLRRRLLMPHALEI